MKMKKTKIIPKGAHLIPKEAECVFKGIIFDVYQWDQELYDGSYETFEMLKRPDTVSIAAIREDKVVVLKESQPGRDEFIGFPGGRADRGEIPIDAAKRELLEETGMKFSNWKLLDVIQPQSKIEWFMYSYLATDFESQEAPAQDPGEKIELMELTFDEVKRCDSQLRLGKGVLRDFVEIRDIVIAPEFSGREVEI